LDSRVAHAALDAGETEAISLALETRARWVILDDLQARRLAKDLGLAVVGTAGVLFAAKQRGFIGAVRPPLDALRAAPGEAVVILHSNRESAAYAIRLGPTRS